MKRIEEYQAAKNPVEVIDIYLAIEQHNCGEAGYWPDYIKERRALQRVALETAKVVTPDKTRDVIDHYLAVLETAEESERDYNGLAKMLTDAAEAHYTSGKAKANDGIGAVTYACGSVLVGWPVPGIRTVATVAQTALRIAASTDMYFHNLTDEAVAARIRAALPPQRWITNRYCAEIEG